MFSFSNNRRGMGVFVVLISIILFSLFTFGLHNYLFVQRISQDVSVVSLGGIAAILAESAVSEAGAYIAQKMNTPGEMLFDKFRRQADGMSQFEFEIDVPLSSNIIQEWPNWNFSLTGNQVQAKVLFQRPFKDIHYEKYGALQISAEVRVKSGFSTLVKRTISVTHEFKMALITTPRPFEQMTFYLNNVTGYINATEENGRIGASLDAVKNNLPARRQAVFEELDRVHEKYGVDVDQLKKIIQDKPLNQDIPPLKNFPADFSIYSTIPYFTDMRHLDLPSKIQEMEPKIQASITRVQNAVEKLWDTVVNAIESKDMPSDSEIKGLAQEFADSTKELSDLHVERLKYYNIFQSQVSFATGSLKTRLNNFFDKFNTAAEWRTKAFHLIDDSMDDVNNVFNYLMSEYQPLNGIVFVDNSTQTLKIEDTAIFGKLVVVCSGNVELKNVSPYRDEEHSFTVISYGKMKLSGTVIASLCPMNGYELTSVSTTLKGNLVLPQVFDTKQFKGNLSYNELIFSGTTSESSDMNAKLPYYFIALGPRIIDRNFVRVQGEI